MASRVIKYYVSLAVILIAFAHNTVTLQRLSEYPRIAAYPANPVPDTGSNFEHHGLGRQVFFWRVF